MTQPTTAGPVRRGARELDPVIGLETHVELGTASKMFCCCPTEFGAEPNTQVCPTCLGLPGSLPVVNETAIDYAMMIGLALNCSIAPWCRFARKNYFYPDMPKDFQISQYDEPLCFDGYFDVDARGRRRYRVAIERVHMEEDTGKILHVGGATGRIHGADYSLVDYNRAGIPLVEIVTKPIAGTGIRAAEVAKAYVTELARSCAAWASPTCGWSRARCAATSTSRCVRRPTELGTRTETKNVNSLPLGRASRAPRGRAAGRHPASRAARSTRRRGTSTRTPAPRRRAGPRRRRRTTATSRSPTSCRSRSTPTTSRQSAPTLPEPPSVRRAPPRRAARLVRRSSWSRWQRRVSSTSCSPPSPRAPAPEGAQLVDERVAARPTLPASRRPSCRSRRPRSRGSSRWSTPATCPAPWPVRCSTVSSQGRASPTPSSRRAACSGQRHRRAAGCSRRRASPPTRTSRRRSAAARSRPSGAVVGAVMKATRGQADAAAVRALILSTLGVTESLLTATSARGRRSPSPRRSRGSRAGWPGWP